MNIKELIVHDQLRQNSRRTFIYNSVLGLGGMAMASMGLKADNKSKMLNPSKPQVAPHHPPKIKSIIFVHLAGAPPQLDMFDYKPELAKVDGKPCPQEFLKGKQFAFIPKGSQPYMLGPQYDFKRHGKSGAWVSSVVPHISSIVDDVCFIKSMQTSQFNHAPAQFLMYTGFERLGRPSLGAWSVYGLGSENENLPGFVVLSSGQMPSAGKSVWGSGFLPTVYQGIQCRSKGEPVLFLENPKGISQSTRKRSLNMINKINQREFEMAGDNETLTRIAQYEMAFKMQMSVPEVMDISKESKKTLEMYGAQPGSGSFANNCLLARRLVEQGVRYVQLFDTGWDMHGTNKNTAKIFTQSSQRHQRPSSRETYHREIR